jgi:hypothetical protein
MNNQIKNNIIDKINTLDDMNVINALNSILDNLNAPKTQKLSKGEKDLIMMGLEDYKSGRVIDDTELRKEEDQWLKE